MVPDIMTARTSAQRRDAVRLSNASGYVRKILAFHAPGAERDAAIVDAVREALAVVRVTRVDVNVMRGSTTCSHPWVRVSVKNVDQHLKAKALMAAIGFQSPFFEGYVPGPLLEVDRLSL